MTEHGLKPRADVIYDVAVIGAGLVGAAIARELLADDLRVVVLDAGDDVGAGTSKANTAILHTGFDAKPGTLESRLVRRGYELLTAYGARTGIPIEGTGALLVAWTREELAALPGLQQKARHNGYDHCEIVDAGEIYRQVPRLAAGALGALSVPHESVICSWTTALALATEAKSRGATFGFGYAVSGMDVVEGATTLHTGRGDVRARWVVNAAGLGGDVIDALFGYHRFTVRPRRGELLVFDKQARALVDKIVLAVPSALGKGVLISPTIYGNVMLGPTAQALDDRTDTSTSAQGVEFLLGKGADILPALLQEEVTAAYAGLRAATEHDDYIIDADAAQRYVVAGGIRSTGLTACMAIAEHVRELMIDAGLERAPREHVPPPPRMPNLGEAYLRPYQDERRIAREPAYGHIVCFCERVTDGELRDAFASPLPPPDLEGLRRRTRVMNGRCQGFYCGAAVSALVDARGEVAVGSAPLIDGGTGAVGP